MIGRKQGLHRVRLEAAGRGDAQAGVREDAAHGQHVDPRLEAELARGQFGHGGPVGSLELDAQAAAPQRQEIRSVGAHVIDQQGVRGRCPCQSIAGIRFTFAVAVAGQLHRCGVAEDQVRPQGRLGHEIVEHHRDDASAPRVAVDHMVPGVERCVVGVGEVPPVALALRIAVTRQLHRCGVAEGQVRSQGCLGQQCPYHSWREIVEHHRDDASASSVAVGGMIPGVALGFGEEPGGADLAGDLRRGFALVPVVGKLCAEGAVDVGLRGVLRNIQGVDGVRDLGVYLGLRVCLGGGVGLALQLQRVARVLERGHQGPDRG